MKIECEHVAELNGKESDDPKKPASRQQFSLNVNYTPPEIAGVELSGSDVMMEESMRLGQDSWSFSRPSSRAIAYCIGEEAKRRCTKTKEKNLLDAYESLKCRPTLKVASI